MYVSCHFTYLIIILFWKILVKSILFKICCIFYSLIYSIFCRTEMVFYIQERSNTGATRRLLATEVYNFFNQNHILQQLKTGLFVSRVIPKTGLSADQLKQYMDNPPEGTHLWTDITFFSHLDARQTLCLKPESLCLAKTRTSSSYQKQGLVRSIIKNVPLSLLLVCDSLCHYTLLFSYRAKKMLLGTTLQGL